MNLVNHTTYSQTDYQAREVGDYLVVPVVMMTEGVRSGSGGSILHLEDYYSENSEAWNGVPVTAMHPETADGQMVSVNRVDESHWVVGHIQNARVEDGKLKADVHINRQRTIAVNPEVLNYILEGKKLEVSIGAFTQDRPESGEYEGSEYHAVTVNYDPDHLALLPGSRGACSWSDGCGIRNNQKSDKENMTYVDALKEAIKNDGAGVQNGLQDNAGFLEYSRKIQNKLDRMDSDIRLHYLKEIYDNYFIYKVRNKDSGEENFYRHDYQITEQEEIEFIGEPTQVRRNIEFVPMQGNQEDCGWVGAELKRTKFNNNKNEVNIMSEEAKNTQPSGEVMEKVVGLVNNEQTRFTKSDRPWLLNLNESQLNQLEPVEPEAPEVTREQALEVLGEDLSDIDKVKELVTNEVAKKIEKGLETYEDIRENLIKTIQDNTSEEDWPTDTLQDMETDVLQKLAKSVKPVDYSGQGPVTNASKSNGTTDEQPLFPAGVKAGAE